MTRWHMASVDVILVKAGIPSKAMRFRFAGIVEHDRFFRARPCNRPGLLEGVNGHRPGIGSAFVVDALPDHGDAAVEFYVESLSVLPIQ